jgi:hypothetical protein
MRPASSDSRPFDPTPSLGASSSSANYLSDGELAKVLSERTNAGRTNWHVIANSYMARILASSPALPSEWLEAGCGDIGEDTAELLKTAAKRSRLRWTTTEQADPLIANPDSSTSKPAKVSDVSRWIKNRDNVTGTGGRQAEINDKARFEVASQAAWRCQFDGCGDDLRKHFVPGGTGNFAYFAHIVASSSDGPRGDRAESPRLATDPTNIMLMCDKCHRLIDRVAPVRYTTEILRAMRENSIKEVRRSLDSLQYPAAQMLVIGGNIEGQSFAFDERVAEEAMWLQNLRSTASGAEWFARNGGHLGESNSPAYWLSLFKLLKTTDIPRLKAMLAGTSRDWVTGRPLTVFPLHGTSVLVLAGRLIGESRSVHLFQFHRDQVRGNRGGQWAWPGRKPPPDKYRMKVHKATRPGASEALLQVNLTAAIPSSELPKSMYDNGDWTIPTIEVTVDDCNHRVIGDPEDLELFGCSLDLALRLLQDEWRVRTVHLLVIAPVTACVRIGQKMQARFHADFVLYERSRRTQPNSRAPFEPTIRISSNEVTLLSTSESISLS